MQSKFVDCFVVREARPGPRAAPICICLEFIMVCKLDNLQETLQLSVIAKAYNPDGHYIFKKNLIGFLFLLSVFDFLARKRTPRLCV